MKWVHGLVCVGAVLLGFGAESGNAKVLCVGVALLVLGVGVFYGCYDRRD